MRFQRKLVAAASAALIIVVVAANALAAGPKKGAKFRGTLIEIKAGKFSGPIMWGKFHAPVSFKVSRSGKKLLGFTYGYVGCFGFGGVSTSTDIYTHFGSLHHLGTVAVTAKHRFKVTGAETTYKTSGRSGGHAFKSSITTSSTVTGKFTGARTASGTITFTQRSVYNGGKPGTCGPVSLTFSADA